MAKVFGHGRRFFGTHRTESILPSSVQRAASDAGLSVREAKMMIKQHTGYSRISGLGTDHAPKEGEKEPLIKFHIAKMGGGSPRKKFFCGADEKTLIYGKIGSCVMNHLDLEKFEKLSDEELDRFTVFRTPSESLAQLL